MIDLWLSTNNDTERTYHYKDEVTCFWTDWRKAPVSKQLLSSQPCRIFLHIFQEEVYQMHLWAKQLAKLKSICWPLHNLNSSSTVFQTGEPKILTSHLEIYLWKLGPTQFFCQLLCKDMNWIYLYIKYESYITYPILQSSFVNNMFCIWDWFSDSRVSNIEFWII